MTMKEYAQYDALGLAELVRPVEALVSKIGLLRVPTKVLDSVVRGDAVVMASRHARRARPNERFQHQPVQEPAALPSQADLKVSA